MELALHGRRALVTGASSGLGLGCAQALAAEGAQVTLLARTADRLAAAAATIPTPTHSLVGDLSELASIPGLVAAAEKLMGGIDIVIVNAGGPPAGNFATIEFEQYEAALRLNLLSGVALCQAALPGMRERGWGRIVAITSTSVREPIGNLMLSNTARAGFTAFLKTVATEVAPDGVTVNTLQPGLHVTDRITSLYGDTSNLAAGVPTRTLGDAGDFGRIAAFLCSDSARYVTGVSIPVDGGALRGLQ